MRSIGFGLTSAIICAGVLLGGVARAQTAPATPAPDAVPEALPFDIPYGAPITIDHAKKAAGAAEAECRKHNWKMAITIVDPSGGLVFFEKMDGTQNASVVISEHKARAAATFRRETKAFEDLIGKGTMYITTLDGVIGSRGGLPLVEKGKIIGAIGVSGGACAQDLTCAQAGADTVK
jgi:uncharacterized protein GlcG (DUF336 family)